jgi:HD-GYP domain-containing protein (c-di-GMP phosphodiesterase class II)
MDPEIVQALVGVLEAKDYSTAAHTWRVVLYTRALAEAAGLSDPLIRRLTYGAALHDVGKIDVPDEILQKPGPLTPEEFEVIKTHTTQGHERLVRMGETDPLVLTLVRNHHEQWDGRGYPDGLRAHHIPVGPRFFAVIDTFDAMTSVRPYRAEVGPQAAERAIDELLTHSGTRYCAEAVTLFTDLYRKGGLGWILEYFNDTCPVPDYRELGALHAVRP